MDDRPLSLREQGIQALREGDDDRAIDLLTRAVLVDSRDAEARACLGITASRKGLHVRAISALREAVSLEPENTNFRYNLGVALERAGEPREAGLAFQETLQRAPAHAQARQKLAALTPPPGQSSGLAEAAAGEPAAPPLDPVSETPAASNQSSPPLLDTHPPADDLAAPASDAPAISAPATWPARTDPETAPPSAAPGSDPAVLPANEVSHPPPFAPPPVSPAAAPPPAWRQPPPAGHPNANPYSGGYHPVPGYSLNYLRPHRGGMVLGPGIGSIVGIVCCGLIGLPLGIAAWVTGNSDLKQMDAGAMDPSGRSQTQTGRVIGIVTTALSALGVIGLIVYMVIAFLAAVASVAPSGTP